MQLLFMLRAMLASRCYHVRQLTNIDVVIFHQYKSNHYVQCICWYMSGVDCQLFEGSATIVRYVTYLDGFQLWHCEGTITGA